MIRTSAGSLATAVPWLYNYLITYAISGWDKFLNVKYLFLQKTDQFLFIRVVTRLQRVTKASDSMVSLRRLRPSWGGDLALTKGTFLAMLVGHYTRLDRLVANSAQAVR